MNLTILGAVPSKKNSKQVFRVRGRMIIVPGQNHQNWHEQAMWQLKPYVRQIKKAIPICKCVTIMIFAPDLRKGDLTNKTESIMDLLVDAGILADDNWTVCPMFVIRFGGVDRVRPRAEVVIS